MMFGIKIANMFHNYVFFIINSWYHNIKEWMIKGSKTKFLPKCATRKRAREEGEEGEEEEEVFSFSFSKN